MATLIRIHFQPGPWNSFVPVTGLRFPLALIPACLTPSNTEQAGNSATAMPLYLQTSPHITATHINSNSCGSTEKKQGGLIQVVATKMLLCLQKSAVNCHSRRLKGWHILILWISNTYTIVYMFVYFAHRSLNHILTE